MTRIYDPEVVRSHGSEYCAYYAGRASIWYRHDMAAREDFRSDGDWQAYLQGRRHAQAEERLDADGEWE
ncbi:MAG: hypothetical protein J2P16_01130 [Mycobacterium sp.]|nr:hypothetical protein [Mycobacterium sp.]